METFIVMGRIPHPTPELNPEVVERVTDAHRITIDIIQDKIKVPHGAKDDSKTSTTAHDVEIKVIIINVTEDLVG